LEALAKGNGSWTCKIERALSIYGLTITVCLVYNDYGSV
jgi:hypothetical protein